MFLTPLATTSQQMQIHVEVECLWYKTKAIVVAEKESQ
jgi:hypothetical protein